MSPFLVSRHFDGFVLDETNLSVNNSLDIMYLKLMVTLRFLACMVGKYMKFCHRKHLNRRIVHGLSPGEGEFPIMAYTGRPRPKEIFFQASGI